MELLNDLRMNTIDEIKTTNNIYGLEPALEKNDRIARRLIWSSSIVVFLAVTVLSQIKLNVTLSFDPHLFAKINAGINTAVAILLVAGLVMVKKRFYASHKRIMLMAIMLSIFFLLSYICHHLFTGETKFGDLDHNGALSDNEKLLAGNARFVYYIILLTHIPLACIILPFILFTAYRALTGEYIKHKKLARITWPIWLYVAVTGVIVYIMINPYY